MAVFTVEGAGLIYPDTNALVSLVLVVDRWVATATRLAVTVAGDVANGCLRQSDLGLRASDAICQRLGVTLLTCDQRQADAAKLLGIELLRQVVDRLFRQPDLCGLSLHGLPTPRATDATIVRCGRPAPPIEWGSDEANAGRRLSGSLST